jgi:hypothetical protein
MRSLDQQVWAKPLANGDIAVILLNKNTYGAAMDIVVQLGDIGAFNASFTGTNAPLANATFTGESSCRHCTNIDTHTDTDGQAA